MSADGGARERYERVQQVFHAARPLSGDERAALLAAECADDGPMREEVESLLAGHDRSFLDTPALGAGFRVEDAPAGLTQVGPYRILQPIGAGGMGMVYLAEQENPRRTVALKIIRPGYTSDEMLRRFEHEAQVLGHLRHPGIAQILEAGVHAHAGGPLPFIAMEYIDGPSLLEHVEATGLDRRARLELFTRVCEAVHHAHQKGVIHRDLKPGNILVESGDDGPQPKVLDFGVARVTDADIQVTTLATSVGQLLGTLPYMSPEQAAGDPGEVDVRSDVYSLGVLLFELLTGELPHDLSGRPIPEAIRILREEEPTTLSSFDATYRGDLDTVVRKALEKERDRRYQSAAELAADVRRYLNDEPISAHPPSAMYQLQKFARRHRALVGASAVVLVVLVISLAAVSWQWFEAEGARDLAEERGEVARRRFDEVRALANEFIHQIEVELRDVPGTLDVRRRLVGTAIEYLDRLYAETGDDPLLMLEVASGYQRVGDVQGLPGLPNLGDAEGALASYARATGLLAALLEQNPDERLRALELATVLTRCARILRAQDRADEALAEDERALAVLTAFEDPVDGFTDLRPTLASVRSSYAENLLSLGRVDEALSQHEELLAEARARSDAAPEDLDVLRGLAVAHSKVGQSYEAREDLATARTHFEAFLDIMRRRRDARPGGLLQQRDLAVACERVATVLSGLGHAEAGLALLEEGADALDALCAADPDDVQARFDLAASLNRSGEILLSLGRFDQARARFDELIEITGDLAEAMPTDPSLQRRHGVALYKLGEWHRSRAQVPDASADERRQHWDDARAWLVRCRDHFVELRERDLLTSADAGVPDEIQGEVDAAEAALSELAHAEQGS